MNINNSNYFSASASSNKGFSGLVSGMDTESMVEQMLGGAQKKIDAQLALKQQTIWRQEIYRDIIGSLNTFRNKYFNPSFDASKTTNFASTEFFNNMKAVLKSGSGVHIVGADSTAIPKDMRVKVDQLAKEAELQSQADHRVSSDTVTGSKIDLDAIKQMTDKKLKLKVKDDSGVDKEIEVDLSGVKQQEEIVEKINQKLESEKITQIKVQSVGGVLKFEVEKDSKAEVTGVDGSDVVKRMTGLTGLTSSQGKDGKKEYGAKSGINLSAAMSFDVTLDGVTKTISLAGLDGKADPTIDDIVTTINNELKLAFGENVLKVEKNNVNGDSLIFSYGDAIKNEKGHSFRLTGSDLTSLGIVPGASSQVSLSTKLSNIPGVSGDVFEFSINGVDFKFNGDTTISTLMEKINNSSAGVKLTYSSLSDQFTLKSASTGKNFKIDIQQKTGNLLTKMFGEKVISEASQVTTNVLTSNKITGTKLDKEFIDATIKLNVNGKEYTFTMPKQEGDKAYTADEFSTKFNEFLNNNFGKDNIQYDKANGNLNIKEGFEVSIMSTSMNDKDGKTVNADFLKGNNAVTENTKIDDISGLEQKEKEALKAKGAQTLGELKEKTQGNVSFEGGRLFVTKEGQKYLDTTLKNAVFGDGKIQGGNTYLTEGKDAIVTINGVETTRSSNTFTVDGITMELTGITKPGEEAVISTSRDIDSVVEGFKSFVKDYNELIGKLNGYVDEEMEYRKYPPLTDAQKKEMTDREIELWEKKSKKGLIHHDQSVEKVLSSMREILYTKPTGAKLALFDIGIETGNYKEKGKLHLDEAKLRSVLASNPEDVEKMFTQMQDGIAKQMEKALKEAANPSSGSPGSLIQLAGMNGYASEKNNSLSKKLVSIEERIKDLQAKYEKEKRRYWGQFNRMEQILANFNSQSSMIQSQFMGF